MDPDLLALAAGLGTGLSLIVAIGAQNAYVLRQGLRREHVAPIVAVCAVSDLVLITLGVAGLGALVRVRPGVLTAVAWAGAAFLVGYGLLAARRAVRPAALEPTADGAAAAGGAVGTGGAGGTSGAGGAGGGAGRAGTGPSVRRSVLTCMGLTWLNPHVYLDTVLLLGSIAAGYGSHRWLFAVGAGVGSILWFSGLGFGARFARPVFAKPTAWRVLDCVIAVTMIALGARMATLR